ncbi:MAG TPA: cytochrome c family protein [Bacteroidota bacterium]|nr:cytochrome c family protein [Bacteroidota bacterium]
MRIAITVVAVLVAFMFVSDAIAAENKYVGTKACAMCHKAKDKGEASVIWQKSAHANAYKTLQNEQSAKIAKEKGLTVPANEAPECLKCHVTGGGVAKNVDKTFDMKEGVTCEACHGAASGFKTMHAKKENKAKAVEAGMLTGDAAKKTCETCHNKQSPTFKGFKYDEYWAKIAHMLPKK